MCQRLLLDWQETGPLHSYKPVDDLCTKMQVTPALQPDAVTARLEKLATVGAPPFNEALASLMDELERDTPNGLEDAPAWAKKALDRVVNWIGSSGEETGATSYLQSRVTRALNQAVLDTANEFTNRLNEYAIQLMEMPGKRIAATEAALHRMATILHAFGGWCRPPHPRTRSENVGRLDGCEVEL